MLFKKTAIKQLEWRFIAIIIPFIGFLIFGLVNSAEARGLPRHGNILNLGEFWQPPRGEVRLNLVQRDSGRYITSRIQGVCYDVMEETNKSYYLYFGLGFQVNGVVMEPTIGYDWQGQELVIALRTSCQYSWWRTYSNLECQPASQSYYYLLQAGHPASKFIELGAEVEGWGNLVDSQISNGIGINFAFTFHPCHWNAKQSSKLRLEAAVQYREMDGLWKPQAIVRFVFTPQLDEHTPRPWWQHR